MSTFNGVVTEFPGIQIDNFQAAQGATPPVAFFLSHAHTDHLRGLEFFKGRFVYCSPATRQILLNHERYQPRMHYQNGILERRQRTYSHLDKLLKPIPLNTPTNIELTPLKRIRVTLLDANHCVGAVMFLIEDEEKAILYTGDIRSEPWWVDCLARNPVMMPYFCRHKTIDMIYLDTTFAVHHDIYRTFPTKQEGLNELLQKMSVYKEKDTIFHFNAWTYGYEDVWITLSNYFNSRVHLDKYRYRLYSSLAKENGSLAVPEAAALCGYKLGNDEHKGCLTTDTGVCIHSCERGTSCPVFKEKNVVKITPILKRTEKGEELPERGAGGGGQDLVRHLEVEYDVASFGKITQLCIKELEHQPLQLQKVARFLREEAKMLTGVLKLDVPQGIEELPDYVEEEQTIVDLISMTAERWMTENSIGQSEKSESRSITFPYSRHSSYEELCNLVDRLRPVDVWPCTVDEKAWSSEVSVVKLFGDHCSGTAFAHDNYMRARLYQRVGELEAELRQLTEQASSPVDVVAADGDEEDEGKNEDEDAWESCSEGEVEAAAPASVAVVQTVLPRRPKRRWMDSEDDEPRRRGGAFRQAYGETMSMREAFGGLESTAAGEDDVEL